MDARHANSLQIVADFRVGMGPGPRQMQPRRMQWIKTERREDRRVSLTCQPRVGSESGLHRLWAPHLPFQGKVRVLDDRNESRRASRLNKFLKSYNELALLARVKGGSGERQRRDNDAGFNNSITSLVKTYPCYCFRFKRALVSIASSATILVSKESSVSREKTPRVVRAHLLNRSC
ncbi:hypothetical protein EV363DRAFT_1355834 [Boletus edulis]|nr:hypothetical protein EV363DRAFT_1355834 [Boletus edulis]